MYEQNRLSEILYKKGLTYRKLSKISGVSRSAINKIANFETRLIPASEKIVSLNMSEKLDDVADKIDTINKNITIISQSI